METYIMYSVDIWRLGSDLVIPHKEAQHSKEQGVQRAYRWMLGGEGAFVSVAFR